MTTTPQAALLMSAQNPLLKRCYTMSESHLSGYRVVIGFERLEDAQDAHEYIAKLQATQEPGRVFPPRIMELLEQVADRNPGAAKGPWEDAQGLPMQDDADAAISWIKARSVATQETVQAGELPDEREAFEQWWRQRQLLTFPKDYDQSRLADWGDAYKPAAKDAWQARAALSARKPLTDEQREVLNFLLGSSLLDGCAFGDRHPEVPGNFWWRKDLRDAFGIGLEVKP